MTESICLQIWELSCQRIHFITFDKLKNTVNVHTIWFAEVINGSSFYRDYKLLLDEGDLDVDADAMKRISRFTAFQIAQQWFHGMVSWNGFVGSSINI